MDQDCREPARALACAAAAGVLVGLGIVATRFAIGQTGPISLALLRYVIGVCCLLPPVLLSPRVRFAPRDLGPIGLLGIAQFGILIVLLNYGLQYIPASRAALIFATMPVMTMILARAVRRERFGAVGTAGVLLTVAGVGFTLGDKAVQPWGHGWTGEVAVFLSALTGALCSVLYRPYLRKYPALSVGAVAMLASVVFLAVPAAGEGLFTSPLRFTPSGWLAVLFIGASSGAGYYLWLWALGHTTPTRVTVFLALSPVTAAAAGALALAEPISTASALGIGCVGLGLWLAQRQTR